MSEIYVFRGVCEVLLFFPKFYFSGNPDDEDSNDGLQKKDFNFLSKEIGSTWKRFARQFDIEDYKVIEITNKSSRLRDKCYDVFLELAARYGSVKWKPIKMALQELELVPIIRKYLSSKHKI